MNKEIVSISLGLSSHDYEFDTKLFGKNIHIRRFGTDGDVLRARKLVAKFDGQVDAIGLNNMNISFKVGRHTYIHRQIQQVARAAQTTPVVDGIHIKNTLERWAISQVAQQHSGIFSHKRIFVVSGIDRYGMAQVLTRRSSCLRSVGPPIVGFARQMEIRSFARLAGLNTLLRQMSLPATLPIFFVSALKACRAK
jgi:hypothetical protein